MTPPRRGDEGARGRSRTSGVRLQEPVLRPWSDARWCSLTSSRRDARRPGASGGSRTPVSASVERRRVRRTTKAVLFAAGARQMRTDGGENRKAAQEMHPDRAHSRTRKRPPRRCPGRPVVRRCGQTTGPPESPARNEDTPRYATGSTTCRCSRGSTGRRRSCWTGSRTALLLSVMSGWPTHRNVVDRGRPYAPSRVRTTPFPEFIGIPRQPGRSRSEERRTPFLHASSSHLRRGATPPPVEPTTRPPPAPARPRRCSRPGRHSTAWHTFLRGARRRRPGRPVGAVGALGAVGGDR